MSGKAPFISASDILSQLKVFSSQESANLKGDILRQLRILDEQNAIKRYRWYNCPAGLDPQLMERILYYRGQGCFFYIRQLDKFFFLPYALYGDENNGSGIDCYGRYVSVTPMTMGSDRKDNFGRKDKGKPFLSDYHLKCLYDVADAIDPSMEDAGCVLLSDYSIAIAQTNIPRSIIQAPILDFMAEIFPLARTSLISNSGTRGIRVGDEDEAGAVAEVSDAVIGAALTGRPYIPIQGKLDWQELTGTTPLKSEEYLLMLQAVDNYRLSLYGLDTGGLFQKKSHMLESEQNMNAGHARLALQDGLDLRQEFCDRVNAIWGLGLWCEVSESALGVDKDGDGTANDDEARDGAGQSGEGGDGDGGEE